MENILPRREARENAFLLAFSQTFGDIPLAEAITSHEENDEEHPVDGFSKHLLNAYYDHSAEVDDEIRAHLRNWTMERLPRVSLTILRLAVAEMLFGGENKPGVAINEAVELTKKYGADEDYQFLPGLIFHFPAASRYTWVFIVLYIRQFFSVSLDQKNLCLYKFL